MNVLIVRLISIGIIVGIIFINLRTFYWFLQPVNRKTEQLQQTNEIVEKEVNILPTQSEKKQTCHTMSPQKIRKPTGKRVILRLDNISSKPRSHCSKKWLSIPNDFMFQWFFESYLNDWIFRVKLQIFSEMNHVILNLLYMDGIIFLHKSRPEISVELLSSQKYLTKMLLLESTRQEAFWANSQVNLWLHLFPHFMRFHILEYLQQNNLELMLFPVWAHEHLMRNLKYQMNYFHRKVYKLDVLNHSKVKIFA